MGIFSSALEMFQNLKAGLEQEVAKYNNDAFLREVLAVAAWVSAADGTIDETEKRKILGFITISPELKMFDQSKVVSIFNEYVGFFEFDKNIGIDEVSKLLRASESDVNRRRTVIRLAMAIGSADGDFDDSEKSVVREVCTILSLRPSDFGL